MNAAADAQDLKQDERTNENCPEKIILCIDLSKEMNSTLFKSRENSNMTALQLAKKMIDMFVKSKHIMNPLHQFAVVALYEEANWLCDFTSSPETINSALHHVKADDAHELNLSTMFQVIYDNDGSALDNTSSSFTLRSILIYGRSLCLPFFSDREIFQKVILRPKFFLDFLYIHDIPTEENNCQSIYETFCDLAKPYSYLLDVTKNTVFLYDSMAKLLAHPLQRCLQEEANYNLHRNSNEQGK